MNRHWLLGLPAALIATAAVLMTNAAAQPPAPPAQPNGEAIFRARCAGCHDQPEGRTPSRELLRQRTTESVVAALTNGMMSPQAAGLSQVEVRAVATYVTGRPLGAAAATPAVQVNDKMCATHPPIRAGRSDWNGWGVDQRNSRFQPNPGFTAQEAPRLKLKWAFSYRGARYGQPTVIGDRIFLTSDGGLQRGQGRIYSIDAETGCVHWRKDVNSRSTVILEQRNGRWIAYFAGLRDGTVYAVDATTGADIWQVRVETHPMAVLSGSPILHGDLLYIPTSSWEETAPAATTNYQCCTFRGSIIAVDLRTGRKAWQTYMIDQAPAPTRLRADGHQQYGPGGAAIWSQPTVDAKRGLLYVATGDSYTEVPTDKTDAVVALELATGRIRWHNQTTANDNYLIGCGGPEANRMRNCPTGPIGPDHDYGSSPILRTLPNGKDILIAGQKSGMVYGMDPDDGGKTVWSARVGAGGALGGVEWGMTTVGNTVYAANADRIARQGRPGLYALDIATGRQIWAAPAPQVPCKFASGRCSNAQSAAPSGMPGAVFAGTYDGRLRAYDAADGKVLWEYDTTAQTYDTVNGVRGQPGGAFDATGPTIAGGKVFVLSGYGGGGGTAIGNNTVNVLLAFSVDGK